MHVFLSCLAFQSALPGTGEALGRLRYLVLGSCVEANGLLSGLVRTGTSRGFVEMSPEKLETSESQFF